MSKSLYRKSVMIMVFLYSANSYSQLIGSDVQIWEKSTLTPREVANSKDENLLNFHYGIKDRLLKKYIKHSKNKSHTLSLVHTSKNDEKIWENDDQKISLSNDKYESKESKKTVKIQKRPSIFSFTGNAEKPDGKSDSLKIRFEDQNLYEMIFIPRKAKAMDLNKIHSYLSIKYGISLQRGKYYGSDAKLIWDPEKHKEFKHRPTGLGRDDGNELYQKQSSNVEDQFLTIGKTDIKKTNTENTSLFDHNNFVIWSDDDKAMSTKADGNFNVLERNWEINFIGSTIPKNDYKIRIDKKTINPDSLPIVYWMFLKNSAGEIKKFQGVENENYVDFSKVDFSKDKEGEIYQYFTFAVSPLREPNKENESNPGSSSVDQNLLSLDLSQIVLYPNPVKKGQNFTVKFPEMENLSIAVYDGGGRLVKLEKIDHRSRSYSSSLIVQSSYLITLTQNGKVIKTFKLIVD
ncbi:T9SS type A sorting domain-containing protein [Chryseobacterium sp. 3008163]|uniref:T9SS type A sorting domain-containing protein n=1 Tax=Chryseobacterium sp. 3008163 TaxID=2478663 RepID=UPI000F0C2947|nr:T9SS type A sorting domain-containing protein [Chryseobacterium sp. 3008163]AYM99610.1 T9SS C-terminal target domain-containing protein [Chryseobacterium sp. 3008163]